MVQEDIATSDDPTRIPQPDLTGVDSHNLLAAMSYLAVLVVVPLWLVPSPHPFVRFHARQGLVVFIGLVLAVVAANWVSVIGSVLWILFAILSVVGFIQALLGRWWKIPWLGDLAAKFRI